MATPQQGLGTRRLLLAALVVVLVVGGVATAVRLVTANAESTASAGMGASSADRCTGRVLAALRSSASVGPEGALDAVVRLYGTESTEYRAFLAAMTEHGFGVDMINRGVDVAAEAVTPAVRADCAAGPVAPDSGDVTSADPCVAVVLEAFERIAATGDYSGGASELISRYGVQSPEFLAYNQLQPIFVTALMRSGGTVALRETRPRIESICAGGPMLPAPAPAPSSSVAPVPPSSGAPDSDQEESACMQTMSRLLHDVVEGLLTSDAAQERVPDEAGRAALREALAGAERYQVDGLSREDAIIQARDAFTYYCPQ